MKRLSVFISLLLSFSLVLPANAADITGVKTEKYEIKDKKITPGDIQISENEIININADFSTQEKLQTNGGAVYIDPTYAIGVNIINSNFNSNQTAGNAGAVWHTENSSLPTYLNIIGSKFLNNSAEGDEGAGAIYIKKSSSVITDSIFNKNTATKGCGGAIYADENLKIEIINVTFSTNTAIAENGNGGALFTRASTTTIKNSRFYKNEANNINGRGGAIYASLNPGQSITEEINIENTYFELNKASVGGALYTGISTAAVSGSTFYKNNAVDGGAVYSNISNMGSDYTKISGNSVFTENTATEKGGAVYIAVEKAEIEDSEFIKNEAQFGGAVAVYNNLDNNLSVNRTVFSTNTASVAGGAIYNPDTNAISKISESKFLYNTAVSSGGAIYCNHGTKIEKSLFRGNKSGDGGAVFNRTDLHVYELSESEFTENKASQLGGAVCSFSAASVFISTSVFRNNEALFEGGAVYSGGINCTKVNYSDFYGNESDKSGGALFAESTSVEINNSYFKGNNSKFNGGAVNAVNKVNISDSDFYNNNALNGGALYTEAKSGEYGITTVSKTDFVSNSASGNGGAICSIGGTALSIGGTALIDYKKIELTDVSFIDNSAKNSGGALYSGPDETVASPGASVIVNAIDKNVLFYGNRSENGGAICAPSVTINAIGKDVIFSGNSAVEKGADIFINSLSSPVKPELTINVAKGRSVVFDGGIYGPAGYNINISKYIEPVSPVPSPVSPVSFISGYGSGTENEDGAVIINSVIEGASVNVNYGTLHLAEGNELKNSKVIMKSGTTLNTSDNKITVYDNITLNNNVNLIVDINIADGTADNFATAVSKLGSGDKITISGINTIGTETMTADAVSINIAEATGIKDAAKIDYSDLKFERQTLLTAVRYLHTEGIDNEGNIKFNPTGDKYRDFNPAVMAAPVAVNAGAYLTQLNSYEQAFRDLDMYKLTTINNSAYYKTKSDYSKKAFWVSPYGNFENIYLYDGPKVENNSYGVFFGFESEEFDLGDGWDGILGAYAAYNGSAQKYDGTDKDISISQNGGMLGVSLTGYKNNFFIGMTLNAGFSIASSETKYGEDDFNIITGGVAGKIGWNWKFADGKIIFQPSLLISRSLMNLSDYKNAAGVNIRGDLFGAVHTEQNLKLIGNFNSGFQPYIMIGSVWNSFESNFYANNTDLPEINLRSFVKYGLGARQVFNKNSSGYIQASFADGGKNGIDLKAGYTLRFGKNKQPDTIEEFINYGRIENENRLVKVKADEMYGRSGRPVNVKEQVKSTVNKKTAENRIAKDIEEISQIVQLDDKTKIVIYKKAAENEILKNIGEDTDKNLTVEKQVKSVVNKKNSENTIVKVINADDVNVEEQVKSTVNKKTAENKVAKDIEKLSQVIQLDDKTKIVVYKKAAEDEIVKNMKSDDNGKKSEVAVSSNTKTKSSVQPKKTAVKNTGKSQASRAVKKSSSGKTTKK